MIGDAELIAASLIATLVGVLYSACVSHSANVLRGSIPNNPTDWTDSFKQNIKVSFALIVALIVFVSICLLAMVLPFFDVISSSIPYMFQCVDLPKVTFVLCYLALLIVLISAVFCLRPIADKLFKLNEKHEN